MALDPADLVYTHRKISSSHFKKVERTYAKVFIQMNNQETIRPLDNPLRIVKEKETPVKILLRPEDKVFLDLLATIFVTKILQQ